MNFFKLYFTEQWGLIIEFSPVFILLTFLIIIGYKFAFRGSFRTNEYEIDEAEIGIGNNKIKVKPNYEDMQIAYQLYIELSTRKLGLPIDFDHDFIIEIYDSWYEFFKVTREHIKSIPAQKIRKSKTTRVIVNVAIEVLNEGLRPHLTKWQLRFRQWYTLYSGKEDCRDKNAQDLQKKFPEYNELVTDMSIVNKKLIEYRKKMKQLAIGDE